jgi:hypothetical protein
MQRRHILARWRFAVTGLVVAALSSVAFPFPQNQPSTDPAFDAAIFKSPPTAYRGHAMWNFNLTALNEKDVIAGIEEMAKLNYGGFFIEAYFGFRQE